MKKQLLGALLLLSACKPDDANVRRDSGAGAATTAQAPQAGDEQTLYALGVLMGERLGEFNLTAAELDVVKRGISDKVNGRAAAMDMAEVGPKIQALSRARATVRAAAEKEKGRTYAERAAGEAGALRLPSGLIFRETQAGTGAMPTATDRVKVHYRGTLVDGTEFDSSYRRHEPAEFGVRGVIPCWTEALQRMKVGGKARIVCPSDIAYGDRGQRSIPPGSTLTFEVELIEILPPAPAAANPLGSLMNSPIDMRDGGTIILPARPTIAVGDGGAAR